MLNVRRSIESNGLPALTPSSLALVVSASDAPIVCRGFLDGVAELVLENAVHDDRSQVALLEFQPDIRRIKCVLDSDRNIVRQPQALELPDRAFLQLVANASIVTIGHALLQYLRTGLIAGVADRL